MNQETGNPPEACSSNGHEESQERSKKAAITVGESKRGASDGAIGPIRPESKIDVVVRDGLNH